MRIISGGARGIWKNAVHTTFAGSSDQDLIPTLQLATPGDLECNSVATNRFLYVNRTFGKPSLPAHAVFLYTVGLAGADMQVVCWCESFCGVLWGPGAKADDLFILPHLAPCHKFCTSV